MKCWEQFNGTKSFWFGLASGVLLSWLMLFGLVSFYLYQGISLNLNHRQLAKKISVVVKQEALAKMPEIIEELERSLPQEAAELAKRELADVSLALLGVKVKLPGSILDNVQLSLEQNFRASLKHLLKDFDTESMAERMSDKAYTASKLAIKKSLNNRVFYFNSGHWLVVPVRVKII